MAEVVDGVDALRRAARERLRSGAHAIKIMASGGVISPSDPLRVPQYSPEEIRVVAEEATRRGSYVAAHAYSAEAIAVAVANGVRSIEHGNLLDAPTAAVMAERGAFLVPTLVTYDAMERRGAELGLAPVARAKNREVLDAGRTAIGLAREAGVRIGFGTDLMGALDDEQLHGLRLQAEVEGPLALLRAATSVNAELLGRDDLGRIGPGAVADLLVLDGDPLRIRPYCGAARTAGPCSRAASGWRSMTPGWCCSRSRRCSCPALTTPGSAVRRGRPGAGGGLWCPIRPGRGGSGSR